MKVLWVLPKYPYPVVDGARRAIYQLLNGLTDSDADLKIDLLIFNGSDLADDHNLQKIYGVEKVYFVEKSLGEGPWKRIKQMGFGLQRRDLPFTFAPFASKKMIQKVERILNGESYDALICDGLHACVPFVESEKFQSAKIPLIYRSHNLEYEIWRKQAERSHKVFGQFLHWQAQKLFVLEKRILEYVQRVLSISATDTENFVSHYNVSKQKIDFVPVGFNFDESFATESLPASKPYKLIFVGDLNWSPNLSGIVWFLENVWNHFAESENVVFQIVGKGGERVEKIASRFQNVRVEGVVENLHAYYSDAFAVLSPVFYGSGLRVKAIEAISYGKPLISSKFGVGGLNLKPGRDYIHAETASDFKVAIEKALNSENLDTLRQAALEQAKSSFDRKLIQSKVIEVLKVLTKNS